MSGLPRGMFAFLRNVCSSAPLRADATALCVRINHLRSRFYNAARDVFTVFTFMLIHFYDGRFRSPACKRVTTTSVQCALLCPRGMSFYLFPLLAIEFSTSEGSASLHLIFYGSPSPHINNFGGRALRCFLDPIRTTMILRSFL